MSELVKRLRDAGQQHKGADLGGLLQWAALHINLMAGHGDPDYLKSNGMSIRHVDCRTTKPRAAKAKVEGGAA